MMSLTLAVKRLDALKRANMLAKNPDFKKLWRQKQKELIELLQAGNSYDELTGELL